MMLHIWGMAKDVRISSVPTSDVLRRNFHQHTTRTRDFFSSVYAYARF